MTRTRPCRRTPRPIARPVVEALDARQLLSGMDLIGASATRSAFGVDGSGASAAIIDTGTDYTHDALGGDGFGPGHKVLGGWDFIRDQPDPFPTDGHGTLTAGLVASDDPAHPGVAPGAGIVALRVIGDGSQGNTENIARALQYVIDHAEADRITVVNISLAGGNYSYDFFSRDNSLGQKIAGLVRKLGQMRIPVVSAAGNSYDGSPGMGFTAILPETISVTASDSQDRLLPDAQRLGAKDGFAAATDLAAPGIDLIAPSSNDGFTSVQGTSFAAPLVTGSVLLLQQIYRSRFGTLPAVNDLVGWLKAGATTIRDPASGIDIGRLDLARSAGLIPSPPPTASPSPPAAPPVVPSVPPPPVVVVIDGSPLGAVPANSVSDPLSGFGEADQLGGRSADSSPPASGPSPFDRVDVWSEEPPSAVVEDNGSPPMRREASDTLRTASGSPFLAKAKRLSRAVPRPFRFARAARRR